MPLPAPQARTWPPPKTLRRKRSPTPRLQSEIPVPRLAWILRQAIATIAAVAKEDTGDRNPTVMRADQERGEEWDLRDEGGATDLEVGLRTTCEGKRLNATNSCICLVHLLHQRFRLFFRSRSPPPYRRGVRHSPGTFRRSRSRSYSPPSHKRGNRESRGTTPIKDEESASNNPYLAASAPAVKRPRCRDYDEKGFCMRGDQCKFDHGTDAVVLDEGGAGGPPGAVPGVVPYTPAAVYAPGAVSGDHHFIIHS